MIYNYKKTENLKSDGFTLIELVIVILIIGIISIISYPKFANTVQSMNLRVAIEKLADDLRYVYNYSVTNHRNAWFSVDIGNNSYSYGIYNTPPTSDPVVLNDPSSNQPAIINLNEYNNVTITSETMEERFYFDWWGTPSTGGQITLNSTRTIVVESETGYVYEL